MKRREGAGKLESVFASFPRIFGDFIIYIAVTAFFVAELGVPDSGWQCKVRRR